MKIIMKNITFLLSVFVLTACLDIQGSYDYEPSNANAYLGMTAWEFIEQRQDTFSLLKKAIEYVDTTSYPGIKNLYQQTDRKYTFLFLNNAGFTSSRGVLTNAGVDSISQMDPAVLKDILLYHIVDGFYHSLDKEGALNFDPVYVITLFRSQDALMTMKISNENSRTDFSRLKVNENLGSGSTYTAVTSNLIATNGSIHVFSQQIIYTP